MQTNVWKQDKIMNKNSISQQILMPLFCKTLFTFIERLISYSPKKKEKKQTQTSQG